MRNKITDSKIYYKESSFMQFHFWMLIIGDLFFLVASIIEFSGPNFNLFILFFGLISSVLIWEVFRWKIILITEDEIIVYSKLSGKVLFRENLVDIVKLDMGKIYRKGIIIKVLTIKSDLYKVFIACIFYPEVKDLIRFFESRGLKNVITKETYECKKDNRHPLWRI